MNKSTKGHKNVREITVNASPSYQIAETLRSSRAQVTITVNTTLFNNSVIEEKTGKITGVKLYNKDGVDSVTNPLINGAGL